MMGGVVSRRRHEVRWPGAVVVAAAVAALAGCGASGGSPSQPAAAGLPGASALPAALRGRPAPRIVLADARSGAIDTARLRGRPFAVTFLYASCPDVCPLIAQEIVGALGRLGADARRVAVVAVSVDPRGDTPAAVRAFLRVHHAPPQFAYGVGSAHALAPIWRAWFAAPQIPGRPESVHTAAVWLVDRRGRLVAKYDGGTPIDPGDLAAAFRALLRG